MAYPGTPPTGRTVVTMPTTPPAPAGLEFTPNHVAGFTPSPFSGRGPVYDWSSDYMKASYSLAVLTTAQGQAWAAFLMSCNGPVNVFAFPQSVCEKFPVECTQDGNPNGATPRFWQLEGEPHWTISKGSVYRGLTFECREV